MQRKLDTMRAAAELSLRANCVGIWMDCDVAFLSEDAVQRIVDHLGNSPICFQPECLDDPWRHGACTGFFAFQPSREVLGLMDVAKERMEADPEILGDQMAVNQALAGMPEMRALFPPELTFTPGFVPGDKRTPEAAAELCADLGSVVYHANWVKGPGQEGDLPGCRPGGTRAKARWGRRRVPVVVRTRAVDGFTHDR